MYTKNTPPLSNSINNQGNLLQVSFLVLTPWIVSFPASYLYSVAEPFLDADESNFTLPFWLWCMKFYFPSNKRIKKLLQSPVVVVSWPWNSILFFFCFVSSVLVFSVSFSAPKWILWILVVVSLFGICSTFSGHIFLRKCCDNFLLGHVDFSLTQQVQFRFLEHNTLEGQQLLLEVMLPPPMIIHQHLHYRMPTHLGQARPWWMHLLLSNNHNSNNTNSSSSSKGRKWCNYLSISSNSFLNSSLGSLHFLDWDRYTIWSS